MIGEINYADFGQSGCMLSIPSALLVNLPKPVAESILGESIQQNSQKWDAGDNVTPFVLLQELLTIDDAVADDTNDTDTEHETKFCNPSTPLLSHETLESNSERTYANCF